ncbi:MAG: aminopeptidase [Anaerolineales bacterium]|nr:aminopeptidase [Anaerolineales bacterium]
MSDPRVTQLADLLVNYSVAVQPGETVFISGTPHAMPLVVETYRHVLRAGGLPTVYLEDDVFTEILLCEGNDAQLQHVAPPLRLAMESYDCRIGIRGAANTRTLSNVDLARQQRRQAATRELTQTFMRRSAAGELRWVGTLYPTQAYAQDADMSLDDFADFVYRACHVDQPDPVAWWLQFKERQQKLVDWLHGRSHVQVKGPNVDLTLSIADRTFVNSHGRRNMPCGEIFTGPVEDSVNGWIRFTYPAIYQGREVEGVELRFEDGRVVAASARKNEAFLHSVLDTDAGARYLGEFAVGTNHGIDRFTRSILFDEKIGGTIHLAVGAGYPETGSHNKSAVHWDMICDMRDGGQIWVDGELFYDSGRFLLEQA